MNLNGDFFMRIGQDNIIKKLQEKVLVFTDIDHLIENKGNISGLIKQLLNKLMSANNKKFYSRHKV